MRYRFRTCGGLFVALAALIVAVDQPVGGAEQTSPRDVFRTGVELVQVTATVRDLDGRLVGDLDRLDFEVFEDGRPQRVTQFQRGRVPISLGIVLDKSESMYGQRMDDSRFALKRFLVDLLEPTDEVFLIVFNHDPELESLWTTGPASLEGRFDDVRPYGATAIYDAMSLALPMFETRAHQRAAVVIISDGSDTASDVGIREVQEQVRRSDAFVYAVGIDALESRPINDRLNPQSLRDITDESGGYTEVVRDSPDLVPATERIAEELNHQYTIGYTPNRSPDGRYHSIRVSVRGEEYVVRARRGYVATP